MNDQIVAALIGASATLIGSVITVLISDKLRDRASSTYRHRLSLPDPLGKWKCDWFNEDGSLYISDEVNIEKWIKNGRFQGKGIQPTLSYTFEGEIDGTRVMALTYRTADFPTKAYVGVACLVFNMDGDSLSGYWYGRAKNGEFKGGKTNWYRKLAA